ncbi:conserved protein, unknown function [Hepatocystis sp. ex Piliocolobus tephrosceles]|nr:conserved protein, unknown function [Hepatocystis sp. ex Piliocolobus tephrosceles]VWU51649.1 conserved protein, unknown function [Hepatocystis sp. ex Piliocolobus tephrosceles]
MFYEAFGCAMLHEHNKEHSEDMKCENEYNVLLDCLDKFDRNWSKCQTELKVFRLCYNNKNENSVNQEINKKNTKGS